MQLKIIREPSNLSSTIGSLLIDGKFFCWTLEDVVREVAGKPVASWKIQNMTAIPRGKYDVTIDMSPRFKRRMPLIKAVPGFEGVRIHVGNRAEDTDGCILLGYKRDETTILKSADAFNDFFVKLNDAVATQEPVTIQIV